VSTGIYVSNGIFSTPKVFIDSNGDAEGNYTVVSMLPFHGKRSEASASDETTAYVMQPVGYFQYNSSSNSPNDLPVSSAFFPFSPCDFPVRGFFFFFLIAIEKFAIPEIGCQRFLFTIVYL
jgi:hypothetical protein